ncbi:surface lipoprotein assembly modifier [Pseudosulfitobacter koreensis]|uniref:Surface lipoprotein assembly modifier n=1 Tax=Pseudosulfitobacter koreensis TaxID=2968472 RepID=A0ABT1YX09_9RHOB|nr:surface lipoprotein assembly modifier [Pseudosulfitobacter koreense]MCR8825425.1 surface lipoprotein assembly modifier [Pseudosulfitobacter koreense]
MTFGARFFLIFSLVTAVALAWPQSGHAFTLDAAEKAVLDGQAAQVIPQLEAYAPKSQTEALRRLWILGVANARAGRPDAAVAPLSKLVAQVPANPMFRLELAGALVASGQHKRARYHLEQVKGADLPPQVQTQVQNQIDRLERSKNWQGYFRFALTPESNAARRTQAETVNLGGLVFNINPNAREEPATGVELGFGLAALPMIGERTRARFGIDAQARLFDGRAPDDVFLRATAGIVHFDQSGRRLTADVFATQRRLDNSTYTRSQGLALGYGFALGQRARLSFGVQHEQLSYVQSAYDVRRAAANVQLAYAASAQLVLRAGARFENRSSAYSLAAGHAQGLSIGGDYTFVGGLRVGLDLSYDHNDFDGIHPLYGVQRMDRKTAATVHITNQNWSYRGFAPVIKFGVERQNSNIVINSYRNVSTSLGVTRSF